MSANVSTHKLFSPQIRIGRGSVFGAILIAALIAFEIFNFSTTEYALADLLGNLTFAGISWATILTIAFCGIDFAGIARLFTPQYGPKRGLPIHSDTWYLFGAWLLAATMNAVLTWWGISLAIAGHETFGAQVVERGTLLKVVPVFVSLLVWLIRVLIIGTFSTGGDALLTANQANFLSSAHNQARPNMPQPATSNRPQPVRPLAQPAPSFSRSDSRVEPAQIELTPPNRPAPSYHPMSASARRDLQNQRRVEPGKPFSSNSH